ncbi:MAG: WcaF family extracellular polysaccharide biosynthesis acetyltransferase [Desulfobulbaceae bacterium]|nr:WcaF family extracellular polysaccharide biosynthesis acetyltransferase [Desulfobulbaceae bacterium]
MNYTDLSKYNNDWFDAGAGVIKRSLWFVINVLLYINPLNPFSSVKVLFLKWFGAKIGRGVVIKPSVNIKYPWKLQIGDYTWVGERVWIDNLEKIKIGNNCCLSQGAMLLCGNHNFEHPTFDLIVLPITLENGVWIGAQSIVTGGVTCHSHAMLVVQSTASSDLDAYGIYRGNPAKKIKDRNIGL